MSQHTPHELSEEFPDHKDKIHALKESDEHFAELAEAYHQVNRDIHRMETEVEPVADLTEHELRKRRLQLKDEIASYLR
ncbi:YdcH family protein [Rhodovibrio salinarum]|uniref:DUF465 domain-containing protein n=1 Tax=Rhodovibrio salinarum TaxID=1087 RepID=A0A934QKY9_9PROT|nr:DUF465 domain-containing protein [Rhodovibrio salinarum]MBK1698445.1 DUF465 domain-containing protein [Rhodovibrio salinarum]